MTTMPGSIPVPADFPVTWPAPEDERMFWFQDNLHFPVPVTPINASLFQAAFAEGTTRAISKLSMPIAGLGTMVQNGYLYLAAIPVLEPPEVLAARFEEMKRIVMEIGPTVLHDWRTEFEPEVLRRAARVLDFDFARASTHEIAQLVTSLYEDLAAIWEIHMRVNIPPMNAVFGFEEFLQHVVGDDAVTQSRQLLQGFDNKSVALGQELWALSRWTRSVDGMAAAVAAARARDGDVEVDHPRAPEFEERLQAFLEVYGWRSDVFGEFGHPSWREDPSAPLVQLKALLQRDDSQEPLAAHGQQAADRDRLTAELAERVPEPLRGQFHGMLAVAQQYIPIAEDHNFTIDQKYTTVVRHALVELGRKLAADGVLAQPDDVFFLLLHEIEDIAAGGAPAVQGAVRERRQQFVAQAKVTPPPALGTPPPADMTPDPLVTKFFGFGAPMSTEAKLITGYPASSGVVTGIAKVVVRLEDADKLEPGDILVCRMTMPAWTPLFGIAGGIVADSGGPLSHCAIVAREYRIPCVAGTQLGTTLIQDGMRLRVDGSTGRVQILD
jgi:rifampicin phosphotransferase